MNKSSKFEVERQMPTVPSEVVDALARLRRPLFVSHVVPDADALGSMCAMALGWSSSDVSPSISLPPGSLSQRLAFLVDDMPIPMAEISDFKQADGFVTLDTAKKSRCNVGETLKETDWSAGRPIVNIDHHATNTMFGDVNWVDANAGSTCEMVYYLLRSAGRTMNATIATLIYAGIQTDTLGFSLPSSRASAMRACADLVDHGAQPGEIGQRIFRSLRQSEFNLTRLIYDNTRVVADGQLAYSSAGYDEIRSTGCTAADIDEQINVPRSLEGVRLAILFTEGNRGKTRMNFRCVGDLEVLPLANKFGGGGHAQAAGAVVSCGLEEAMAKVLPEAEAHLNRHTCKSKT